MNFKDYPEVLFTFSTISDGNMSFIKGDPKIALKNRLNFLKRLGVENETVCLQLEHSTTIVTVDKKDLGKGLRVGNSSVLADGLVTDKSDIFLFLLVGDCLPIAFYVPGNHIISLVHASRLNLEKRILEAAIKKLKEEFNVDPNNLIAEIGPSIGPCCYSWDPKGPDVFWRNHVKNINGKTGLDLWQFTEDKLKPLGILEENIHNQKICTYHSGQYFSHRKFVEKNLQLDSRFAAVLGMKNG